MKTLLLLIGLSSCAPVIDANVEPAGPAQYSITECKTGDCYRAAATVCPYGFDKLSEGAGATSVTAAPAYLGSGPSVHVRRERELLVQCKPPVFCDRDPCAFGYHCVHSKSYPGHNVCAT